MTRQNEVTMNFLDAFKIVYEYESALGKKIPKNTGHIFRPMTDLPVQDKDIIISAFQIFFAHVILYNTRTQEQYDQYRASLVFLNSFISENKMIKVSNVSKIFYSKNIFISKSKKEQAQREFSEMTKCLLPPYRDNDVDNYVNKLIDFKKNEVLPHLEANEEIHPIIVKYVRKAYEEANIKYLDEYILFFKTFDTLRQALNVPSYAQFYKGYEKLIRESQ